MRSKQTRYKVFVPPVNPDRSAQEVIEKIDFWAYCDWISFQDFKSTDFKHDNILRAVA